jgi:TRAP-type C4-dicarboxylate transport system permease small subunit
MAKFKKILDAIVWFTAGIAFVCVLLMMLQIVGDVVGRYGFNHPIDGTMAIVSNWYMVAIIFLPMALVQRHGQHVATTFFAEKFSEKTQRVFKLFADIVMFSVFAFFGVITLEKAFLCFSVGEFVEESYRIIIWPVHFFLPLGAWAMCLHVLYDIIKDLKTSQAANK